MMPKIILLNGPKECGKNVAVDRIKETNNVVDCRCKDHLFVLTAALFGMPLDEFFEHYECRETKEVSSPLFKISAPEFNRLAPIIGVTQYKLNEDNEWYEELSVREALIYVSEVVCKPAFGSDYFGVIRAESIGDYDGDNECAIDDSCGFDDEILPTIEKLGMENVMLIRIHGRGSFDGDSRSYISDGIVENTVDVYNVGTEEEFLTEVSGIASDFMLSEQSQGYKDCLSLFKRIRSELDVAEGMNSIG